MAEAAPDPGFLDPGFLTSNTGSFSFHNVTSFPSFPKARVGGHTDKDFGRVALGWVFVRA